MYKDEIIIAMSVIMLCLAILLWIEHRRVVRLRKELDEAWDFCAEADAINWRLQQEKAERRTEAKALLVLLAITMLTACSDPPGLSPDSNLPTDTTGIDTGWNPGGDYKIDL